MEKRALLANKITKTSTLSTSVIAMTKSPQFHGHSKHISIKYHFIKEVVIDGMVEVKYCPTQEIIADMLTKGLPKRNMIRLVKSFANHVDHAKLFYWI